MEMLITEKSKDYELLDSGDGQKLERYGSIILSRPDPQALWPKSLPETEWKKADAVFTRTSTSGKWNKPKDSFQSPARQNHSGGWRISLEGLTFNLELLPSKHLGLFPEQSAQWKWLSEKILPRVTLGSVSVVSPRRGLGEVKTLSLFGYTGGASLTCAKVGASVCHVDSSEFAVNLANKNMKSSGLSDKSVRFIVDDVRKFVEREIKRGNKYDIILMDPPVYGKGPKGESWKIEDDLMPLLSRIKNIISDSPVAIVLNGYASGYSATTYAQMLQSVFQQVQQGESLLKGKITHGELTIKESSTGRLLPCGIFARWES